MKVVGVEVRAEELGALAPAMRRRCAGEEEAALGQEAARVWGLPSPSRRRQFNTVYCLINHEGVHMFI